MVRYVKVFYNKNLERSLRGGKRVRVRMNKIFWFCELVKEAFDIPDELKLVFFDKDGYEINVNIGLKRSHKVIHVKTYQTRPHEYIAFKVSPKDVKQRETDRRETFFQDFSKKLSRRFPKVEAKKVDEAKVEEAKVEVYCPLDHSHNGVVKEKILKIVVDFEFSKNYGYYACIKMSNKEDVSAFYDRMESLNCEEQVFVGSKDMELSGDDDMERVWHAANDAKDELKIDLEEDEFCGILWKILSCCQDYQWFRNSLMEL